MRKEPPRYHMKAHKHKEVSEKLPPFRKKNSVFAQWNDTSAFLESDYKKWKIDRFVKTEEEQAFIKDYMGKHVV